MLPARNLLVQSLPLAELLDRGGGPASDRMGLGSVRSRVAGAHFERLEVVKAIHVRHENGGELVEPLHVLDMIDVQPAEDEILLVDAVALVQLRVRRAG